MSWFNGRILVLALSVQLAGCVGIQLNPQERNFLAAVDDLNIQTEFNARLIGESGALFANVNSTVIEGRLHITGTVPAQADRQKVTRIAWTIPSVKEVVNDIEVTSETGLVEAARDRWITAQLRALMIGDNRIRDSNYAIDTENGIIYLNGIAQNREELERVMEYAKSVTAARQVVSYVIMKDDPRRVSIRQDRLASQDQAQ
jgi:osmotically-inducible protein OsmY